MKRFIGVLICIIVSFSMVLQHTDPIPIVANSKAIIHQHYFTDGVCKNCGYVCTHNFKDGICQICKKECNHKWENGTCSICLLSCNHNEHDETTRKCIACNEIIPHIYENNKCTKCKRMLKFYSEYLPDDYYVCSDCEGKIEEIIFNKRSQEIKINIYTPYGYNEKIKYDVLVLIGGVHSSHNAWLNNNISTKDGTFKGRYVFDNMIKNGDCSPVIIISIGSHPLEVMEDYLRSLILPYVVENYSTYATSMDDISTQREHFAMGGFSWGGYHTYYVGMGKMLDVFSNFCPVSGSTSPEEVAESINTSFNNYEINKFMAACGTKDGVMASAKRHYEYLLKNVPNLIDGENAFFIEPDFTHNWNAAFSAIHYFLQTTFP